MLEHVPAGPSPSAEEHPSNNFSATELEFLLEWGLREQTLWSIFSQPFPKGSVSVLRLGSEIRMLFSLSYLEIWLEDWQCYFLSHFEA